MDKSYDLHDNIHTLTSILHSHVCETESQISSLQQTTRILAHGQDLSATVNDTHDVVTDVIIGASADIGMNLEIPPDQDKEALDDEAVIHELEKIRLDIVMEIQEENFISLKLKEMIGECEDLVGGVTGYYNSVQESRRREGFALEEYGRTFNEAIIANVKDTLDENISRIKASQARLYANAKSALESFDQELSETLTLEHQQELSRLIDTMNTQFGRLAGKGV